MKQCPVCKTTYTDETLKFCLADGTNLVPVRDEEATIQMSADRNPLRIDLDKNTAQMSVATITASDQKIKKGCSPLLIGGLLALLLTAFVGIAAAVYFFVPFKTIAENPNSIANSNQNAALPPKNNSNADDINGKIANLEKQLQAQKNQKQPIAAQPSPVRTIQLPTDNYDNTPTATVAPTGDGFLSLRTEPSVKTGVQLIKIPTGATVNLNGKCQNPGKTADGKTGRWCLVSYNNQTGWVFDAYLIR